MPTTKILATLLLSVLLGVTTSHAAPYIPASGSQIIEHLPGNADPVQQEFKRLRAELTAAPDNLPLATELARRYIEQARSDGDPRYLGYAQAALGPWWNIEQAPAAVRLLRATLLQSTHRFPEALADLNAVLKFDRDNGQAWLTRATVLQVQGEYAQAKNSCMRLARLAPELIAQTCLANVASLNGEGKSSYAQLSAALKNADDADPAIKLWVLTLLAEIAQRNGDAAAAETHFKQAISLDAKDSYLLAAYADFLLDRGRAAEVIALLKNKTRVDALLLRYALALKAQGSTAAHEQIDALRARFDAAMLRGDTVHQREQARFELQLMQQPKAALKLAQQNWQVQKEPADVRIYLEAAAAAGDKAAAQPLLLWLKQTRLEDRAAQPLIAKLGGN